ncbi:MAG: hypothetical protein H8E55_08960 [Pelagibacterales bacterium]|nr:hypothetical protein [Pelagibacterales bacterium]
MGKMKEEFINDRNEIISIEQIAMETHGKVLEQKKVLEMCKQFLVATTLDDSVSSDILDEARYLLSVLKNY